MVHPRLPLCRSCLSKFKYILCYGSSADGFVSFGANLGFKYILCYGSSDEMAEESALRWHLNTSYVMVHL